MRTIKYLFLLLAMVMVLPLTVFAEGEEEETTAQVDYRVKVYFFRGEGCPHCAEAEEWFEEIKSEYGDMFVVEDYETWYDETNSNLMKQVAEVRGEAETATGVPYIIIGDKSWVGFDKDLYADEMLAQINTVYGQDLDARYDALKAAIGELPVKESSTGKDVVALLLILLVVSGICFGIYKARNATN
jgi:glutaredoxin